MKGEMDSGTEVREICKRSQEGQGSESSEGGNFDCNICLELAQDPVVTLCGHLFCWPCLYKWFQLHSFPKECPVCKACVDEEKVIPLYGRGKVGAADPRTKMVCIPNRPSGHRPETSRPPSLSEPFYQSQQSFNFMSGHSAMPMSSLGNITFSAGFGLFPYLFGFQMHGFADSGYRNASNGLQRGPQTARPEQDQEAFLSRIFLFLGCLVVVCFLFF